MPESPASNPGAPLRSEQPRSAATERRYAERRYECRYRVPLRQRGVEARRR